MGQARERLECTYTASDIGGLVAVAGSAGKGGGGGGGGAGGVLPRSVVRRRLQVLPVDGSLRRVERNSSMSHVILMRQCLFVPMQCARVCVYISRPPSQAHQKHFPLP